MVMHHQNLMTVAFVQFTLHAMTGHPHLHHFEKGILSVTQWTSKEHNEMQKVFLGILASVAPPWLLAAAHGLLNFI
jgi:hypothetical protein